MLMVKLIEGRMAPLRRPVRGCVPTMASLVTHERRPLALFPPGELCDTRVENVMQGLHLMVERGTLLAVAQLAE